MKVQIYVLRKSTTRILEVTKKLSVKTCVKLLRKIIVNLQLHIRVDQPK